MKAPSFLALLAASLLFVGPVQAHGDEKHGEEASAAPAATNGDVHDQAAMAQMGETADAGESSGAHDEAGAAHDEAGGHADESETGVMAVLKKLHPATIHFPIALFFMAAATELFVMRRKGAGLCLTRDPLQGEPGLGQRRGIGKARPFARRAPGHRDEALGRRGLRLHRARRPDLR